MFTNCCQGVAHNAIRHNHSPRQQQKQKQEEEQTQQQQRRGEEEEEEEEEEESDQLPPLPGDVFDVALAALCSEQTMQIKQQQQKLLHQPQPQSQPQMLNSSSSPSSFLATTATQHCSPHSSIAVQQQQQQQQQPANNQHPNQEQQQLSLSTTMNTSSSNPVAYAATAAWVEHDTIYRSCATPLPTTTTTAAAANTTKIEEDDEEETDFAVSFFSLPNSSMSASMIAAELGILPDFGGVGAAPPRPRNEKNKKTSDCNKTSTSTINQDFPCTTAAVPSSLSASMIAVELGILPDFGVGENGVPARKNKRTTIHNKKIANTCSCTTRTIQNLQTQSENTERKEVETKKMKVKKTDADVEDVMVNVKKTMQEVLEDEGTAVVDGIQRETIERCFTPRTAQLLFGLNEHQHSYRQQNQHQHQHQHQHHINKRNQRKQREMSLAELLALPPSPPPSSMPASMIAAELGIDSGVGDGSSSTDDTTALALPPRNEKETTVSNKKITTNQCPAPPMQYISDYLLGYNEGEELLKQLLKTDADDDLRFLRHFMTEKTMTMTATNEQQHQQQHGHGHGCEEEDLSLHMSMMSLCSSRTTSPACPSSLKRMNKKTNTSIRYRHSDEEEDDAEISYILDQQKSTSRTSFTRHFWNDL